MGRTERYCMSLPLKMLHKIIPSLEELSREIRENAAETRKFFEKT